MLIDVDFNNISFTVEVPAESNNLRVTNITIVDDDINEREEIFVLVARILGQAVGVACFQLDQNSPCKSEGHIGGTRLRIRDNDGKYCIAVSIACNLGVGILLQIWLLDLLKDLQL